MDIATAQRLNDLTQDFYRSVSESFSATRQAPWKGWERVRELAVELLPENPRVLDLACGNLRFESYLAPSLNGMQTWAVDNNAQLASYGTFGESGGQEAHGAHISQESIHFQQLDMVQTLLDGNDLFAAIQAPACNMAVCFGFMHHVALPQHRAEILRALVDHTRPGGLVVVSLWQFEHDERLHAKATPLQDAGDYLLGWQGRSDVQRYCHSFSSSEVDELVASLGNTALEVERYQADGKTGDLNCYLVLRAKGATSFGTA